MSIDFKYIKLILWHFPKKSIFSIISKYSFCLVFGVTPSYVVLKKCSCFCFVFLQMKTLAFIFDIGEDAMPNGWIRCRNLQKSFELCSILDLLNFQSLTSLLHFCFCKKHRTNKHWHNKVNKPK